MTHNTKNFGIASPKVKLLGSAPYINKNPGKMNFDISADMFPMLQNSGFFAPLLTEAVIDVELNTFSVLYPSKRKIYMDNFLKVGSDETIINKWKEKNKNKPYATWTPCSAPQDGSVITALLADYDQEAYNPSGTNSGQGGTAISSGNTEQASEQSSPKGYKGPVFQDAVMPFPAPPNDELIVKNFLEWLNMSPKNDISEDEENAQAEEIYSVYSVEQTTVRDGLWWGVQSSDFILEDMPFWINIRKREAGPSTDKHPTIIAISFGSDENRYDLVLNMDGKPKLFDYLGNGLSGGLESGGVGGGGDRKSGFPVKKFEPGNKFGPIKKFKPKGGKFGSKNSKFLTGGGGGGGGGGSGGGGGGSGGDSESESGKTADFKVREWDVDLSRIAKHQENIEIGIMTAGARLIIHINNIPLVYTRIESEDGDNGGKIKEAKIVPGGVAVYLTNVMATINVCPMTYAPLAVVALPIPSKSNLGDTIKSEGKGNKWKGVNKQGNERGSVAELPDSEGKIYGVDCKKFSGDGGTCSPDGIGFHKKGKIEVKESGDSGFAALEDTNFYFLAMQPQDGEMKSADGKKYAVPNMGCPYFFRLKGCTKRKIATSSSDADDVSDYVLSITETATAPDYFHVKKNATITFYDENGIISAKLQKQKAIQIRWGWNENTDKPTFTGIVTGFSISQTPGMETVTAECSDYMHILTSTKIINSPFYDGMVAAYAITDLAERGGCNSPKRDFSEENDYFLPSGFAYTKPAWRFPSSNSIFECIISTAKRFEAFFYFDGDGRFVVTKLPGGLFSSDVSTQESYVQNPKSEKHDHIILGEKNVNVDLNSTVNQICIFTLERDTRNAIVLSHVAKGAENRLLFKKAMFIDQPAYGEIEVARKYAVELGQRVFKPILKTNIKVVGGKFVMPLDFINVNGHPFRVMSFKRSFSAEANDFTQDLECEWLGG